jgi:hypothetical protein
MITELQFNMLIQIKIKPAIDKKINHFVFSTKY